MQSSKVPALPKGLPVPAEAKTTYAVYIAQKQWRKVEEVLWNPEDMLIAEVLVGVLMEPDLAVWRSMTNAFSKLLDGPVGIDLNGGNVILYGDALWWARRGRGQAPPIGITRFIL